MTDVLDLLLQPEVQADPYPAYERLRMDNPVCWSERGSVYVLSRHADVRWAFNSSDLRSPEPEELSALVPKAKLHQALGMLLRTLPMTNPPVHTRLRRLVQRDFTARRVQGLWASVEQTGSHLLDRMTSRLGDGEVVDLHEDFSKPLALNVIADLLGVPESDQTQLGALVVRMLVVTNPAASESELAEADAASSQVEAYFSGLVAKRRAHPRDDLVSALVSTHADEPDRLTEAELMTMIWALWVSGFETSAAGIDVASIAMMRHPEHAQLLAAGRAELQAFVAEALRHNSPNLLTGVFRIAAKDVEVGGIRVPAGADIRMLPGSANRDPTIFPNADRFDPGRNQAPVVTFGHGMRHCLGAHLAQMEISVALRLLHARCPDLALADGAVRRRSLTLRTYDRLPVAK